MMLMLLNQDCIKLKVEWDYSGKNNVDLFGHDERDKNAIAGKYHLLKDRKAFHI